MANQYFAFKRFTVWQADAAMKVGTDGVLLGAWAEAAHAHRALDIGTGTGLIALMIAQRSAARVDAVEIEPGAAGQARQNFVNSPWADRLHIYNQSIQEFTSMQSAKYDLIACNPPYFEASLQSEDMAKAIAKHHVEMGADDILKAAAKLLNSHGSLALIIPYVKHRQFTMKAALTGLHVTRQTTVYPKEDKKPHRCLLQLSPRKISPVYNSLSIRTKQGYYTTAYKILTNDFYLD